MVSFYILDTRLLENQKIYQSFLCNTSNFRKEKIDQFVFEKDKKLCLGASIILDKKLREYGFREKDISYSISKTGKPSFAQIPDLHFSISHSANYAVVAFSDQEIGCDIEQITTVSESMKKLCLSEKEQIAVTTEKDFFFLWSVKESYIKAIDKETLDDLRAIDIETIKKDFNIQRLDDVSGYSIVICYKETQNTISPMWITKEDLS